MYPVGLHMHIAANTHAYSILSGYTVQARQKSTKFFAITDHGPDMEDTPHHWYFTNIHAWSRVVDGVGILRDIEASIKNVDGEIDCSGKMFGPLDLIITGFHELVFTPHDKVTNTQTMIATIASGNVYIISHPRNPKYEIDVKAVAGTAARHQMALEINNSSFLHSRKGSGDNRRVVAVAVRDAGGWVALSSDSHIAFAMGGLKECLKVLDMVDFPPERVSSVSPRRLSNSFESRSMAPVVKFAGL